jgi:hypothetical protein
MLDCGILACETHSLLLYLINAAIKDVTEGKGTCLRPNLLQTSICGSIQNATMKWHLAFALHMTCG